MYQEHFGISELPFNLTSDPRFFYGNRTSQEAFTGLRCGIKLRKGLIVLTGEAGTGKTTLLRLVAEKSEPNIRTTLISQRNPSFPELLQRALPDLGLPKTPEDRQRIVQELRRYLVEQLKEDRVVAVLIDEAQDLDVRTLMELAFLSDLESDNKKLLQIVLAGRLDLERNLEHSAVRSLKQRIAQWYRLSPLNRDDIARYIDYRLAAVGHHGKNLFDPHAVEQIAVYSQGIPRLINKICNNALLEAYATSKKNISRGTIETVAKYLQLTREAEPKAAAFSALLQKGKGITSVLKPAEKHLTRPDPETEDQTVTEKEWQSPFETVMVASQDESKRLRWAKNFPASEIALPLATVILAASIAVLYVERSKLPGVKSADVAAAPEKMSKRAGEKPPAKVFQEKSFADRSPSQMPQGPDAAVAPRSGQAARIANQVVRKTDEAAQTTAQTPGKVDLLQQRTARTTPKYLGVDARVFVHTAAKRDGPVLEKIGEALRLNGYTTPDTRLTSGRTRGDVRFFFPQDRREAERVKSVVESELGRRGYHLSLQLLARDGKKFQFAAPGKIEVWLPPLPKSR